LFYRDLATAAIEVDPDGMVVAMEQQVRTFTMPGTGIPGFTEHAKRIANAGIYDLTVHHEQILVPVVLRTWDVENIEGLSQVGEEARERLMKRMAKSGKVAKRLASRREESLASA
jgi:acyl-[acyl-carrier-protein] desaturase